MIVLLSLFFGACLNGQSDSSVTILSGAKGDVSSYSVCDGFIEDNGAVYVQSGQLRVEENREKVDSRINDIALLIFNPKTDLPQWVFSFPKVLVHKDATFESWILYPGGINDKVLEFWHIQGRLGKGAEFTIEAYGFNNDGTPSSAPSPACKQIFKFQATG
ncbi:MAG TPA: hypothetical protein VLK22_02620 [Candidatus Udaeobacter sp.]|nr:hypothetical protein [Candidatus Udaeobacter sp.]